MKNIISREKRTAPNSMPDLSQPWPIHFQCHPWIHPRDAAKAIRARLHGSRKRRKKVSEEVIVEDLFIASLVNHRPWNQRQLAQLQEATKNKNFCERWARALATNKPPTFDKLDWLILSNWRELHIKPEIEKKVGALPGLRDWSPKAIAGLFELGKINVNSDGNFEQWFTNRRKRLGLAGKYPHQIKDFTVIGDSIRIVR
jgi:hypothetical protein